MGLFFIKSLRGIAQPPTIKWRKKSTSNNFSKNYVQERTVSEIGHADNKLHIFGLINGVLESTAQTISIFVIVLWNNETHHSIVNISVIFLRPISTLVHTKII